MPPNDPEELALKDPPEATPPRPPDSSRSADAEPEDWKEVEEEKGRSSTSRLLIDWVDAASDLPRGENRSVPLSWLG